MYEILNKMIIPFTPISKVFLAMHNSLLGIFLVLSIHISPCLFLKYCFFFVSNRSEKIWVLKIYATHSGGILCINLTLGRTCKFIPPTLYKGRGGGGRWMEPLPGVFDML